MPFEQGEAIPFVQPDPRVRVFSLASVGGRGPVNLVLLGPVQRPIAKVSHTLSCPSCGAAIPAASVQTRFPYPHCGTRLRSNIALAVLFVIFVGGLPMGLAVALDRGALALSVEIVASLLLSLGLWRGVLKLQVFA
jgi:hypothetical protein